MSSSNFRSQDSPENDLADDSNLEFSEFLTFEDWMDEEHATVVSGSLPNPVYQANEGDESGAGSSHIGGPSSSKHIHPCLTN